MDASYLSLLSFIGVTLFYYFALKKKLDVNVLSDINLYSNFIKSGYNQLFIYFLLIVFTQFAINCAVIINKCGGSVGKNIGVAALMTFIPWILIFGAVIAILIVFPGFKSAFSNVIGYFAVSSSANLILNTLLVNMDIKKAINEDVSSDENKKKGLESAAEAILKLCGNTSILINQIVPTNFMEYWSMLTPLMKNEYQNGAPELQQKLLDIVVMRDNVGEALWYIYTAILLTSIVQYNLTSRGCLKDPAAMEASRQQYLDDQAIVKSKNEKMESVVYTI